MLQARDDGLRRPRVVDADGGAQVGDRQSRRIPNLVFAPVVHRDLAVERVGIVIRFQSDPWIAGQRSFDACKWRVLLKRDDRVRVPRDADLACQPQGPGVDVHRRRARLNRPGVEAPRHRRPRFGGADLGDLDYGSATGRVGEVARPGRMNREPRPLAVAEAVPSRQRPDIGGKFRVVDFALSNCMNSGIRRMGVIPHSKSHSPLRHLQRG